MLYFYPRDNTPGCTLEGREFRDLHEKFQRVNTRMQAFAKKRGYSLDSIARQVTKMDFEDFDLIVAMDVENLENLDYLAGNRLAHVRMLGSFLDDSDDPVMGRSVPDPYYGGDAGFEEVLDMIESACPAILEHCLALLDNS